MDKMNENFLEVAKKVGAYVLIESRAEWKTMLVGYGANGLTKSAYVMGTRHVWLTAKGSKELLGVETTKTIESLKDDIEGRYVARAKIAAAADFQGIKASLDAYEQRLKEKAERSAERIAAQAQTEAEKDALKKFLADKKAKMAQEAKEYLESLRAPVLEAAKPILVKAEHKPMKLTNKANVKV